MSRKIESMHDSDAYDSDGHLADEALAAWARAALAAGDAATWLIALIAQGEDPADGMTAEEIEECWPTLTDSSSGEEIASLTAESAQVIADTWGSPWREGGAA